MTMEKFIITSSMIWLHKTFYGCDYTELSVKSALKKGLDALLSIPFCLFAPNIQRKLALPQHNWSMGVPGGSVGKEMLAIQETQVRSLVWEDVLEKETTNHSSILALENPMDTGAYSP